MLYEIREVGIYCDEDALYRAILSRRRSCVVVRDGERFVMFEYVPDHEVAGGKRGDWCIRYLSGSEEYTENFRLAIRTLYRPCTAVEFDARACQAMVVDYVIDTCSHSVDG